MTTPHTTPELPILPQSLINTIGDYGMARIDGVSQMERWHRWQLLIAGIKDYAASVLAATHGVTAAPQEWVRLDPEMAQILHDNATALYSRTESPQPPASALPLAVGVEARDADCATIHHTLMTGLGHNAAIASLERLAAPPPLSPPATGNVGADARILEIATRLFPHWREDIQERFVLELSHAVLASIPGHGAFPDLTDGQIVLAAADAMGDDPDITGDLLDGHALQIKLADLTAIWKAAMATGKAISASIPVVVGPGVLCSICGLGRHVACHRPLLSGPNAGEPLDHVFTVDTATGSVRLPPLPKPDITAFDEDTETWVRSFSDELLEDYAKEAVALNVGAAPPAGEIDDWCKYIAGMIETYLTMNPSPEVREAAIAGIVQRRLHWLPAFSQGADVECKRCNGAGSVTFTPTDQGPDAQECDVDCPACKGSGAVDVNSSPLTDDRMDEVLSDFVWDCPKTVLRLAGRAVERAHGITAAGATALGDGEG